MILGSQRRFEFLLRRLEPGPIRVGGPVTVPCCRDTGAGIGHAAAQFSGGFQGVSECIGHRLHAGGLPQSLVHHGVSGKLRVSLLRGEDREQAGQGRERVTAGARNQPADWRSAADAEGGSCDQGLNSVFSFFFTATPLIFT